MFRVFDSKIADRGKIMPNLQFSYYLGKGVYLYTNDKRLHQKIYTIASAKYLLATGDFINDCIKLKYNDLNRVVQ